MSNLSDLQDLVGGIPKPPKTPAPKAPAKPSTANTPVEIQDPEGSEIAAAAIQGLLSKECSDTDRYHAFRALAKATGRDLVVSPWTIVSTVMTFASFALVLVLITKAWIFGKAPSGAVYLKFIPGLSLCSFIALFVLAIVFRRKPDILILVASAAIGLLGAIAATATL
jgi:hypothetical protein